MRSRDGTTGRSVLRRLSLWHVAVAAVAVFLVLLGTTGLSRGHILTGDTPGLVRGTRAALDCVHDGQWTRCGTIDAHSSSVRAFPLLQYIPAAVMVKAGWSDHRILRALGALSFTAFLATLALTLRAGRRLTPMWTPLLLAVALTGPLLFYSTSAFGEMLSAAFVLGCTVAVLERRPVLIVALALIAGVGKETLSPLIVMIGLVVGRDERDSWLPPVRVLGPLLAGSAAAVAAAAAFNQFRYGSFGNQNYLQPAFRITHVRAVRNLWNLLVAPDGGVAWFWTSMSLLLVALAVVSLVALRRDRRSAVPSLFVLLTFAALMIGLATWWSPFGWVAWGPRLVLPILPALAVAATYAGAERLAAAVGRILRRNLALIGLLAVVLVSAWPQAGAPWQADRLARLIQVKDATCPVRPPTFTEAYYDCSDHIAWRHDHNQLIEASTGGGRAALGARIVLLGAVTLLVLEARRRAGSVTPPLPPAPPQGRDERAGSRRCR